MQFLGFLCTAYIPLCLSYGAELTFPLSPALVVGTLTLMGSASSFLLSLLGAFINHEGKDDHLLSSEELIQVRRWRSKSVIAILGVTSFIAFVLSFFIKEDLKRHQYAQKCKEEAEYRRDASTNTSGEDEPLLGDDEDNGHIYSI